MTPKIYLGQGKFIVQLRNIFGGEGSFKILLLTKICDITCMMQASSGSLDSQLLKL